MTKREPGWNLHHTFLEVALDGSLSGAARRLGLTQPTAGRHIDALERALGVTLFIRSRRGLEATAAAHELLAHVKAMAAAHNAILRAASGEADAERGVVRITASEIMSTEVLPRILATVCERYRGLTIELVASNRTENLLRRDCDIAVRMLRPAQDALVAKRIGASAIKLYAHRSYIERRGLPGTMSELSHHRLIGFDRDDAAFRAAGVKSEDFGRERFGFRCDSDVAQLAALRAGVGVGGCQAAIAKRDVELVPVLPKQIAFNLEIWVAAHEKLKATRRVSLVFQALCEGLTSYVRPARP